MQAYISILRGINVSGQKLIKMTDLRSALSSLSFHSIETYIQSGNLIIRDRNRSEQELSKLIKDRIREAFGFDVPVVTRTLNAWKEASENNPFLKRKDIDISRLYITFLFDRPEKERLQLLDEFSFPPDEFIVVGKEIYMYCPVSYGNSKLSNNFFEQKLKVEATTRNLKTVHKLIELGEAATQS